MQALQFWKCLKMLPYRLDFIKTTTDVAYDIMIVAKLTRFIFLSH